jgi:hypothetical protein
MVSPIRTCSPPYSGVGVVIRRSFTKVPFVEPMSLRVTCPEGWISR